MFSETFVKQLFVPADLYSDGSTRQLFSTLAHSSIMRLNKTSMDKLYDLMTMGVKQQVLMCRCPEEMLDVTRNHLRMIKGIAADDDTSALVDAFEAKMDEAYGALPLWELWELRLTICRFFQDRRVKVSIFLQDLQQNLDGTLVIDVTGPTAPGVRVPGSVHYLLPDGAVQTTKTFASASPCAEGVAGTVTLGAGTCPMGLNMYARDRRSRKDSEADLSKPKPWPGPNSSTAVGSKLRGVPHSQRGKDDHLASDGATPDPQEAGLHTPTEHSSAAAAGFSSSTTAESARAGLTLLSTLIRPGAVDSHEAVSLSIFDDVDEMGEIAAAIGDEDMPTGTVVVATGSRGSGAIQRLERDLGFDTSVNSGSVSPVTNDEEDDLLALMDSATNTS
jgi:hypothetical protein